MLIIFSYSQNTLARRTYKFSAPKLKDIIVQLHSDVKNPVLTSTACHESLQDYYNIFFNLTSENLDEDTLTKGVLKDLIDSENSAFTSSINN